MSQGRRLSTRRVFEGRIFAVDVDQVEEPGGLTVTREVTRHRGSVGILAITDDDQIVLVRQYRYPPDAYVWEIPAGRLEPGEAPAVAAARELEEEVGLRPRHLEPVTSYLTSPGFCDEVVHLFRATGLSPVPARPDEDERIEVGRFSARELQSLIDRGDVSEAKTMLALLLEGQRRRSAL